MQYALADASADSIQVASVDTPGCDLATAGRGALSTPVAVTYCYDNADWLTPDTIKGAPTGAGPLLSTTLTSSNLTYD